MVVLGLPGLAAGGWLLAALMVPGEARRLLAIDSKRLVERVDNGKIGPEKVGPFSLFLVANRLASMADDRVSRVLIERALHAKTDAARTHSELFGYKLSLMLTSTLPRLDPESQRGFLHYVCGDEAQHGMAVLALEILSESSGVEVAGRLVAWRAQVMDQLRKQDQEVLRRARDLPPQIQRLVRGALYEAETALSEKDERTARSWFLQVRMLVERFSGEPPAASRQPGAREATASGPEPARSRRGDRGW